MIGLLPLGFCKQALSLRPAQASVYRSSSGAVGSRPLRASAAPFPTRPHGQGSESDAARPGVPTCSSRPGRPGTPPLPE